MLCSVDVKLLIGQTAKTLILSSALSDFAMPGAASPEQSLVRLLLTDDELRNNKE